MSVCSLISHFSYLMSVVSQTAGPISREPRHDSDLRRLVAGGCDSETRKGKGRRRGEVVGGGGVPDRVGTEGSGGCRPREAFPPLALGSRDEQLAMNTCVAAARSTHTCDAQTPIHTCGRTGAAENSKTEAFHNICQLSGRKQAWVQDQSSPSCGPGPEDGTDRSKEREQKDRGRERE